LYIQYTMDQLYLPMDFRRGIPKNHLFGVFVKRNFFKAGERGA